MSLKWFLLLRIELNVHQEVEDHFVTFLKIKNQLTTQTISLGIKIAIFPHIN